MPNNSMKKLEHIGIAVEDLEAAEKIFGEVLGSPSYKREEVMGEAVLTSFFQAGESKVELAGPHFTRQRHCTHLERGGRSAPRRFSCRRPRKPNSKRLTAKGIGWSPDPSQGADGKRIAFLHPSDTAKVLVELCARRLNLVCRAQSKMKAPRTFPGRFN